MTASDTDVTVPRVISGPGVAAGATSTEPVQNIDLAPTSETLAALAAPRRPHRDDERPRRGRLLERVARGPRD